MLLGNAGGGSAKTYSWKDPRTKVDLGQLSVPVNIKNMTSAYVPTFQVEPELQEPIPWGDIGAAFYEGVKSVVQGVVGVKEDESPSVVSVNQTFFPSTLSAPRGAVEQFSSGRVPTPQELACVVVLAKIIEQQSTVLSDKKPEVIEEPDFSYLDEEMSNKIRGKPPLEAQEPTEYEIFIAALMLRAVMTKELEGAEKGIEVAGDYDEKKEKVGEKPLAVEQEVQLQVVEELKGPESKKIVEEVKKEINQEVVMHTKEAKIKAIGDFLTDFDTLTGAASKQREYLSIKIKVDALKNVYDKGVGANKVESKEAFDLVAGIRNELGTFYVNTPAAHNKVNIGDFVDGVNKGINDLMTSLDLHNDLTPEGQRNVIFTPILNNASKVFHTYKDRVLDSMKACAYLNEVKAVWEQGGGYKEADMSRIKGVINRYDPVKNLGFIKAINDNPQAFVDAIKRAEKKGLKLTVDKLGEEGESVLKMLQDFSANNPDTLKNMKFISEKLGVKEKTESGVLRFFANLLAAVVNMAYDPDLRFFNKIQKELKQFSEEAGIVKTELNKTVEVSKEVKSFLSMVSKGPSGDGVQK